MPFPFWMGAQNAPKNDPNSLAPVVPQVGASNTFFPDWSNPNSKVQVDATLVPGQKTLVLCIGGQSLTTNVVPTLYVPTNRTGVQNFSITNGGCYIAPVSGSIDPLLGCTGFAPNLPGVSAVGGHWAGILADSLITAGIAARVIIVPFGIGGSQIADWQVGGANNPRFAVMARRLALAGLAPSCIMWEQGESDNLGGTTQAQYTTRLASMLSTIQTLWPTVPTFVAQASWINGTTSAAVVAAQAAAVSHPLVWAGPNADSLNATNRQSDNTHWNNTGAAAIAGLWKTALAAFGAPFV